MTDELVDCFNCGRANPEWAQVCRSCGVALRHGEERIAPAGPVPTDRDSLISMGAVIGTILLAVVVGLFVANLNPTEPTIGQPSPTPVPTEPQEAETPTPEPEATPTPEPEATPTPEPELPGSIAFGSSLNSDGTIEEEVETFTPGTNFGYSVTVPGGFGATPIENEVVRIEEEGTTTVLERDPVQVDPASETWGYIIGQADPFISAWGSGEYEWRVFVEDELVARGRFRFAEG